MHERAEDGSGKTTKPIVRLLLAFRAIFVFPMHFRGGLRMFRRQRPQWNRFQKRVFVALIGKHNQTLGLRMAVLVMNICEFDRSSILQCRLLGLCLILSLCHLTKKLVFGGEKSPYVFRWQKPNGNSIRDFAVVVLCFCGKAIVSFFPKGIEKDEGTKRNESWRERLAFAFWSCQFEIWRFWAVLRWLPRTLFAIYFGRCF